MNATLRSRLPMPRGLTLIVVAILAVWFGLHGGRLGEMAHRTVLDMRPLTAFARVPVDPAFRSVLVLPQASINFRPEVLQRPVCVILDLFKGPQAAGELVFKVTDASGVLAEKRLAAHQIVDGDNSVCFGLTLDRLSPAGTALEVLADPLHPPQAIDILMGSPQKHAQEKPGLVVRLVAQSPWRPRQFVGTLAVCMLAMGILVLVLRRLWTEDQPVK